MPKYIVFAGPNGCGKSTLYHTNSSYSEWPRINVDEIARENGLDWKNPQHLLKAGKIAVEKLNACFASLMSFNQETTLCGKSIIRNMENAKNLGYSIEIYFVYVDSVQLAKERIRSRVANGGHGIPDEDVERRYVESIDKLLEVVKFCDKVEIFDNSKQFVKVISIRKGGVTFVSKNLPFWAKGVLAKILK